MTVVLYVLGFALMIAGLAGLLLPALPGAPLIYLGIVAVAWADDFARLGLWELLILGVLAALISVVDYLASIVGARRFGASRWGLLGAFLGFVGAVLLSVFVAPLGLIGLLVGPIVGAVLLEYLKDPDFKRAGKVGFGTLVGFLVGTALKYAMAFFLIGLALLFYFLFDAPSSASP